MLVAAGAIAGRERKAARPAVDTARAPAAIRAAQPAGICTRDSEPPAFACSGGLARRAGDTLFIRTASAESAFVDRPADDEQHVEFHYAGRITPKLHVISGRGYETVFTLVFDEKSGKSDGVPGIPVVSPDGARLVSVSIDLDVCEGSNLIWISRMTDALPEAEWKWRSEECGSDAQWGPEDARWISADTIELTRVENVSAAQKRANLPYDKYPHRRIRLVHQDTGWVFRELAPR